MLFLRKKEVAAAIALALAVVLSGVGLLAYRVWAQEQSSLKAEGANQGNEKPGELVSASKPVAKMSGAEDRKANSRPPATVDAVLQGLDLALKKAGSLQADFEAVIADDEGEKLVSFTYRGTFKGLSDGKRYILDTRDLGRSLGDGTAVWGFNPNNPVIVSKLLFSEMEGQEKQMGYHYGPNPLAGLKHLREDFDFSELKEVASGGEACFLLEGKISKRSRYFEYQESPETGMKARLYISPKDSWVHRIEVFNNKEEIVQSFQFLKVKLGEKLDLSLFTFTPPAAAHVMEDPFSSAPPATAKVTEF